MANIALKGNPVETIGTLPVKGSKAPDFSLVNTDLADVSLANFAGKKVILNIFPSVDTGVCAASVRRFNADISAKANTVVLCISADLPFAHKRFCGAEGLNNVISLSMMRSKNFGKDYGVLMTTGPLQGLLSRAVVVIDTTGNVVYTEQVPEITQEPNYAAALAAIA
ncbi:MAG: thiol peroxidase [SAR324 cluster bacterium]|nr:thiol peroxidase [SAR324 cluster bacterium]